MKYLLEYEILGHKEIIKEFFRNDDELSCRFQILYNTHGNSIQYKVYKIQEITSKFTEKRNLQQQIATLMKKIGEPDLE